MAFPKAMRCKLRPLNSMPRASRREDLLASRPDRPGDAARDVQPKAARDPWPGESATTTRTLHGAQRPFRRCAEGADRVGPVEPATLRAVAPTRPRARAILDREGRSPPGGNLPRRPRTARRRDASDARPVPRTRDLLTLHRHSFTRCNRACGLNNPFIFIIAR